ncbi:polymorphic toxin type 50 domain-containing protein [Vreelandella sp. EE27]
MSDESNMPPDEQQRAPNAQARHAGNAEARWIALTSFPDFCRVGDKIIGFDSSAPLGNPVNYSPNVITAGQRTYRVGDLSQGTQGNDGSGVESGTSQGSGHVLFLTGQNNVRANGQPVVIDGSEAMINCNAAGIGGAKGYVHTNTQVVNSQPDATDEPLSEAEELQQQAEAHLHRLDELSEALNENPNGKTAAQAEALYAEVQQLGSETRAQQEAAMEAYQAGHLNDIELVQSLTLVDEAANRAFDMENGEAKRQAQFTSDVGRNTRQIGDFAAEVLLTPYGMAKDAWEFSRQVFNGHYAAAAGVAAAGLLSVIPGVRWFRKRKKVDDLPKKNDGTSSETPSNSREPGSDNDGMRVEQKPNNITSNRLPVPSNLPKNIHLGQQGKHIPEHNNFTPGRSPLSEDINPQQLLDNVHDGTHPIIRMTPRDQPVVDFGRTIGQFENSNTQFGIIHHGKHGAHIVPANPVQF